MKQKSKMKKKVLVSFHHEKDLKMFFGDEVSSLFSKGVYLCHVRRPMPVGACRRGMIGAKKRRRMYRFPKLACCFQKDVSAM